MSEPLPPFRRFEPLAGAVKDRFFLFSAVMLVLFLIDLKSGSPVTSQIIAIQFKVRGVDPAHHHFKISSVFGFYDSIAALARVMDLAGTCLFGAITGFGLARGFLQSLFNKPL